MKVVMATLVLSMKTHSLSPEFVKNIKILKNHIVVAFSSGRNLLYMRTLVKDIFDKYYKLYKLKMVQ